MKKIRVGILFGGQSAEHEVSIRSAKNVFDALDTSKYDPVLIGISKKGEWLLIPPRHFLQIDSQNHALPEKVESNEEFLQFCRENIEAVRFMGSAVIVAELLLDTLMFMKLVEYQNYLKKIEKERSSLNYYTGKERIAIP